MTDSYDLNLLAFHRSAGRDLPGLPGVHVAQPPRRAARGRKNDGFIAYLHFANGPTPGREQLATLLQNMARAYYDTPGSATAALRSLAEGLNETLFNRNLRAGGEPSAAFLTLMALRDEMIFMAQSGPAHGFLITRTGIEHLYDPQASGRGLGLSRTPPVRYFQTELTPGALLLFTPKLPTGWNSATFRDVAGRPLGHAARRFLDDAGPDLQAILLEARPGAGNIHLLRTPPEAQSKPVPVPEASAVPLSPEPPAPRPAPAPTAPTTGGLTDPPAQPRPTPPAETTPPAPVQPAPATEKTPRPALQVGTLARKGWQTIRETARQMAGRLRSLLGRMLPTEDLLTLPASTMAIIAIAVPLVLTTVALVIYFNLGREQGYQSYFNQAQAAAETARTAPDSESAVTSWQNTLALLERAEAYRNTPETLALRVQAQTALDEAEGVFRLSFTPAIAGSLSNTIRIRQMVATGTDLYLLDANSGSVLRAWLTGRGYEMDPTFSCGPTPGGAIIIGPLVDIAPLPRNPDDAAIVAMDGNGNLLYCIPGKAPLAATLIPPDNAWGNPSALAVDSDNLYVLDPLTNAVWLYRGEDSQFREPPRFFFSAEVPTLGSAIDIAVNGSDLLILNQDGTYTLCEFNAGADAQTRCEEPATYVDGRPGRENGSQIQGATFSQLQRTEPPEPSLFFLDPITRSVYHFSLRVNLVRQYRVQAEFPAGLVTSFAISPTRAVFLALGNQVFISYLP